MKQFRSSWIWKDGNFIPNYRKPFDLLASTNTEYKKLKAASQSENGLFDFWLPFVNSFRNQLVTMTADIMNSIFASAGLSGK